MDALITKAKNRRDTFVPEQEATDRRPLVLVVEDHEDTCFLLSYLLELHGCGILVAKDGEDALRLAVENRPDLVLMDISLPRLDGLAVTLRLRHMQELREVPIVFLSGYAEASYRAEALAQGGNDYLVKPFALTEIEGVLKRHLGR